MSLLRHPEHFTHLGRCGCCTTYPTLKIAILDQAVLLAQLLEVRVLQCLPRAQPVIVVVYQQLTDDVDGVWVLRNEFGEASSLLFWEIEVHVTGDFLKLI